MKYWVTPAEMAEFDRKTIAGGTPGDVLMERAGTAVADAAMGMTSPERGGQIHIWCGPGNNGGDGLVAGRLLLEQGYDVCVIMAAKPGRSLSHDCQTNLSRFVQKNGCVIPPGRLGELSGSPALVIDALLGTGFKGELDGLFSDCAKHMCSFYCPVLAVDSPSGVNGTTGQADPLAVRADVTVTFAAPKVGLLLAPAAAMTGMLFVADIGIRVDPVPSREVAGISEIRSLLPHRPVDAHKGTFGRLLMVGGSEEMPGAPQLMAIGALRSGIGLATLAVPQQAAPAVSGRIPEVLSAFFAADDPSTLPDHRGFNAAAFGPGLGTSDETAGLVAFVLENWQIPLVLDADGLNSLSHPIEQLRNYSGQLVLTPHPGELMKLMKIDSSDTASLMVSAGKLASYTDAIVLLKGKPTFVFGSNGRCCLIPAGNNGLATGGSGDVLTGIVSSLLAQGMNSMDAAVLGAYVHGLSADMLLYRMSGRSMLPSDVAAGLCDAFRFLEGNAGEDLLSPGGRWNGELFDLKR